MMKNFFDDLIFPRKCIGCRENFNILGANYDRTAVYCSKCRSEWERAKVIPCPNCRMAAIECSCVPDLIDGIHVVSLFKFGAVREADRLVYSLKRKRLPRIFEFAANELANRMISFCREKNLDVSNAVITHVPRRKSSVIKYGFDHGRALAEKLSEKLGLPFVELLDRRGRGREQKKLTVEKRFLNSSNRFALLKNADIKEKTVIVVDDVITTGATVAACAVALYDGEPENIVVLCLAKSTKLRKSKK